MTGAGLLLEGGTVFDGLGNPGRVADVAVVGGRVVAVGDDPPARLRRIGCDGLAVAPGFVDTHAHSDLVHLLDQPQPFKLLQGVTTEVVGNCGLTFAPLDPGSAEVAAALWSSLAGGVPVEPATFGELAGRLDQARPANNLALLVGHGTLRLTANGLEERLRPGAAERMAALAAEAVEAGAVGLSSGLIYVPGSYAGTGELVALARVAAAYGGVYATHLRDEGAHLEAALDEAVTIAGTAGTRLQVSHCKAAGLAAHGVAGGRDPWDVLCELVAGDPAAAIVVRLAREDDVRAIMASPLVGVGSDNGPPTGLEHPRTWGCFPRLLGRYVRELGVLTWEQAVRKATWLGARQFRLDGRGLLAEGAVADLCVFDPATAGHDGTYLDPDVPVTGIEHVVLAGDLVVEHGRFTGRRAGRVLRSGR